MNPLLTRRANLLKRRHYGRQLTPEVKVRLSARLGRSAETIEFLSLEQSDQCYRLFEQCWMEARNDHYVGKRFFLETTERIEIEELTTSVRPCFGDESMYLFLPEWQDCGAVRLSAADLLANALSIATLDQDDVLACNATASRGVACEYFTDWGLSGRILRYSFLAWY